MGKIMSGNRAERVMGRNEMVRVERGQKTCCPAKKIAWELLLRDHAHLHRAIQLLEI